MVKRPTFYLDKGLPLAEREEKVTSNNSSIPLMFSTKYLNFNLKMFIACRNTSSKSQNEQDWVAQTLFKFKCQLKLK